MIRSTCYYLSWSPFDSLKPLLKLLADERKLVWESRIWLEWSIINIELDLFSSTITVFRFFDIYGDVPTAALAPLPNLAWLLLCKC